MPEVVVMVGLQGCGKSTWVKQHLAGSHMVVSKDMWPCGGTEDRRQQRAIAEALEDGLDVAVDSSNPSPLERAPIIAVAHQHGARVRAVHIDTPAAECLARTAARPGRTPAPKPGRRRRRLVPPSLDEGFDEVRTVSDDALCREVSARR